MCVSNDEDIQYLIVINAFGNVFMTLSILVHHENPNLKKNTWFMYSSLTNCCPKQTATNKTSKTKDRTILSKRRINHWRESLFQKQKQNNLKLIWFLFEIFIICVLQLDWTIQNPIQFIGIPIIQNI